MGAAVGNSGGVKTDINVTPLVDIMLVLLVIFMVTTPMMSKGAPVTLPEGTHAKESGIEVDEREETVLAYGEDKQIWLNSRQVNREQVPDLVRAEIANKPNKLVLIKAQHDAFYDVVLDLVDGAREGGAQKISFLITRPGEGAEK